MTFGGVFGIDERFFTYRDYWTLNLAFYGYIQLVSGIGVSGFYQYFYKKRLSRWFGQLPQVPLWLKTTGIPIAYSFILFLVPMLNAVTIFSNGSIFLGIGILIGVQLGLVFLGFVVVQFPSRLVLISNWSICLSCVYLIQLATMFDYIKGFYSVICVALLASLFLQPLLRGWKQRFLGVLLGFFATFGLGGICVTIYNPNLGGFWLPLKSDMKWSSRWMRSFSAPPCTKSPCHVYLTAGLNLSTEVFVNVHMPVGSVESLSVVLVEDRRKFFAFQTEVPLLDPHDQRLMFTAHLNGLTPGMPYVFRIANQDGIYVGEKKRFTLPKSGLRFVVGGDWGSTDAGDLLIGRIAKETDVVFIGGDVVYDNGFHSCACAWDHFLSSTEHSENNLVPFSFAVGNHDLGVNDNSNGAYDSQRYPSCDPSSVLTAPPLIFSWFPHAPVPVCLRQPIREHLVADWGSIWILDSGYITAPFESVDKFVNSTSTGAHMAIYHVPLYGSTADDFAKGQYLRDAWLGPLLDGFTACFEHHVHAYKRTQLLGRTVYFGDGKMGVSGRGVPDANELISGDSKLFAKTGTESHIFQVELCGGGRFQVHAINPGGEVFDQYGQCDR